MTPERQTCAVASYLQLARVNIHGALFKTPRLPRVSHLPLASFMRNTLGGAVV